MTAAELTALPAVEVMPWKAAPGRYLIGNRQWVPSWRFQPLASLEDAFMLVGVSGATLVLTIAADGCCNAEVKLADASGHASCASVPECITLPISRAIGLDPEGDK